MDSKISEFLNKYPIHDFGKKQIILVPENEERQVFFIKSGFVRAHTITENGDEFSVMLLGPGMYFPLLWYLPDAIYKKKILTKYYYSSLTKTRMVIIDHVGFIDFLKSNPEPANELSDKYYEFIKELLSKLEFMSYTHSAYKKVCYFLLFLSQKFGFPTNAGIEIAVPLTNKEFATFVGLSRESVNHQLSLLREKDIIERIRSSISIKNSRSLEEELTEDSNWR